jgi:hypothetical protein
VGDVEPEPDEGVDEEGTSATALNVRGSPRSKSDLKNINICGMEESGGSNLGGRGVRRVLGGPSRSGTSSCIDAARPSTILCLKDSHSEPMAER